MPLCSLWSFVCLAVFLIGKHFGPNYVTIRDRDDGDGLKYYRRHHIYYYYYYYERQF